MIGLDANVLLRWLIDEDTWPEDDPGQTAAVAALLERKSERFYVNGRSRRNSLGFGTPDEAEEIRSCYCDGSAARCVEPDDRLP
jgi:hypothetical protein